MESKEGHEYSAHTFQLGNKKTLYRKAKITPSKVGQFVTIWKRNEEGITQPFHVSDGFDICLIAARQNEKFGVFIFSKETLLENKILSDSTNEGKRGIRVYPTWDAPTNKQAQKTQRWQVKYFLEIYEDKGINLTMAKRLLSL
jgi:hypothetical protein